ncbi:MAG: TIGR04282 family arsenosugar biosynthesis glycosyltransferase [Verrucomicrobiota bacterium]
MTAAILLKAPMPGQVKTRLAAGLDNEKACAAYQKLVRRQLHEIPPEWNVRIHYTPQNSEDMFRKWLGSEFPYMAQPDSGLGERQQAAVESCPSGPVALIGGDCPYLSMEILRKLEAELQRHDLAMVPALDGGYVTLGMKRWHPGLFEGIHWSTETVATQLIANAASLDISLIRFEPLEDVDTLIEWEKACRQFSDLKI